MIDVLIVDDNPIVRAALRGVLAGADQVRVVAEAEDGQQALAEARRLRPTVTLLDYRMPIADGLSVIGELAQQSAVLVLTSDTSPELIASMLRGGARGFLVHGEFDPPELVRAVQAAADGQGWLSPLAVSVATSALREQVSQERASQQRRDHEHQLRLRFALTEREQEVLALVGEGLSNAAIGRRLLVTEKTVKNHLQNVFTKMQVRSRTEAIARWSSRP